MASASTIPVDDMKSLSLGRHLRAGVDESDDDEPAQTTPRKHPPTQIPEIAASSGELNTVAACLGCCISYLLYFNDTRVVIAELKTQCCSLLLNRIATVTLYNFFSLLEKMASAL